MPSVLIGDHNFQEYIGNGHSVTIDGHTRMFGRAPRKSRYGSLPFAPAAEFELIPRDEWCDRIEQQEKDQSSAYHKWKRSPVGVLNQGQLSYCHAFSCTGGLMLKRHMTGLPYVELSAGSIGGPVTGFRNAGAAIEDDLRIACELGAASTKFVPMGSHSQGDWKDGAKENALEHRVTKYFDLDPNQMLDQWVTMLLKADPVETGHDWWSHAILHLQWLYRESLSALRDAIKSGNNSRILGASKTKFLNSWGKSFGDGGVGELTDSKQRPDEAYVIEQPTLQTAA